ncbi:MAG: hypothetical protein J7M19_01480, partial [Planctomycetes bacterium]|nr:hypothetical protein [Planctomycetota bacterium]
MNLETSLPPLKLSNPLIMASGTFGYGWELSDFLDYTQLGGVIVKTVTPQPRKGNAPPRTAETACGVLNSIGLPNGGIEEFLRVGLPFLRNLPTCRIVSISGESPAEFAELAGDADNPAGRKITEKRQPDTQKLFDAAVGQTDRVQNA